MTEAPQPKAVLTIALMPDGQIGVNGPISEKALCMKMIASALQAIADYQPKVVVPATMVPTNGQQRPPLRIVP